MTEFDEATRVAPCPDEHACEITKIEINFGIRLFMTGEQQHKLVSLIEEMVNSPWNQPLAGVHWVSGIGSKPNFSAIDAAMLGTAPAPEGKRPADGEEPTFDDDVFEIDCHARGFVSDKERARVLAERAKRT